MCLDCVWKTEDQCIWCSETYDAYKGSFFVMDYEVRTHSPGGLWTASHKQQLVAADEEQPPPWNIKGYIRPVPWRPKSMVQMWMHITDALFLQMTAGTGSCVGTQTLRFFNSARQIYGPQLGILTGKFSKERDAELVLKYRLQEIWPLGMFQVQNPPLWSSKVWKRQALHLLLSLLGIQTRSILLVAALCVAVKATLRKLWFCFKGVYKSAGDQANLTNFPWN